jgi:hypothetical protein
VTLMGMMDFGRGVDGGGAGVGLEVLRVFLLRGEGVGSRVVTVAFRYHPRVWRAEFRSLLDMRR